MRLTVADPWTQSSADIVIVSFESVKPVADTGIGGSVIVGDTVILNGTGSSDANGDSLAYAWNLSSVPETSLSVINFYITVLSHFLLLNTA